MRADECAERVEYGVDNGDTAVHVQFDHCFTGGRARWRHVHAHDGRIKLFTGDRMQQ